MKSKLEARRRQHRKIANQRKKKKMIKNDDEYEAAAKMHELSVQKRSLEDELHKINDQFEHSRNELIESMETQAESHRAALQKRLQRRRKQKPVRGKQEG